MRKTIPKTGFQLAPHSVQPQMTTGQSNSDVPMCSALLTRIIGEFVLTRTVWFLVSVFTTLIAIHMIVSLFD